MTKIIGCELTNETCERLEGLMPDDLIDKKLILNIGNSNWKIDEETKENSVIINTPDAVKRAIDKKEMFRIFQKSGINTLKFCDLKGIQRKIFPFLYVCMGGKLVLRGNNGNGLRVIERKGKGFFKGFKQAKRIFDKRYSYATIKEEKVLEYRFIVLDSEIVRVMAKINTYGNFKLKQANSHFVECDVYKFPYAVRKNIINSVQCLGLRLSGVDVLINRKGEFKVIEVNSGMALCEKSVKMLYQAIKERFLLFGDFWF